MNCIAKIEQVELEVDEILRPFAKITMRVNVEDIQDLMAMSWSRLPARTTKNDR